MKRPKPKPVKRRRPAPLVRIQALEDAEQARARRIGLLETELGATKVALRAWATEFEKLKTAFDEKTWERRLARMYDFREGTAFLAAQKALILIAPELERLAGNPESLAEFVARVKQL
jgi:hypothetical protein